MAIIRASASERFRSIGTVAGAKVQDDYTLMRITSAGHRGTKHRHNGEVVSIASADAEPKTRMLRELTTYFLLAYSISLAVWLPVLIGRKVSPVFRSRERLGPDSPHCLPTEFSSATGEQYVYGRRFRICSSVSQRVRLSDQWSSGGPTEGPAVSPGPCRLVARLCLVTAGCAGSNFFH